VRERVRVREKEGESCLNGGDYATLTTTRERGQVMHDHNFKATDIPGVSLCTCGVERYYARELQTYVLEKEGE
jgi:hypothetical protein